ncbi:MAG: UrcA family protein [Gammaproteobacteria bacterium]
MYSFKSKLLILSMLVAGSPIALAAVPEHASAVTVDYGDLDLSSPADTALLRTRIAAAARKVCDREDPSDSAISAPKRICIRVAVRDALSQVKWTAK